MPNNEKLQAAAQACGFPVELACMFVFNEVTGDVELANNEPKPVPKIHMHGATENTLRTKRQNPRSFTSVC